MRRSSNQIINQLRESHAFLPCYELLSYEDPKKKQSETEEVLTPQFVAVGCNRKIKKQNILRLNEYQALETEYKSMTNRNEELGLSEAINQLLQDMPVEAMCQDERPAPTATHSVCIGVLYYHQRAIKMKRIQRRKIIEESPKRSKRDWRVCYPTHPHP